MKKMLLLVLLLLKINSLKMFKFILIISTLFCGVQLIEFDHPCHEFEEIPVKGNFGTLFYEGVWYPIERTDLEGPHCLIHRYTRRFNTTLSFYHQEEGKLLGEPVRTEGIASIAFPEETPLRAIFNATIEEPSFEFQYQVVASGKNRAIFFKKKFIIL
jgi:hypothetical protein